MRPLLECRGVTRRFGDLAAIKDLDFEVYPGETYGIAGPNGAGKTTLFNVITGIPVPVTSGRVLFNGEEIHRLKAYKISHRGIARTFQIPNIIESFNYWENALIGGIFGRPSDTRHSRERVERALATVGLLEKKGLSAKGAPLFDRKRLMLASALAMEPKLLLLDEPVGGLNRAEIKQLLDLFREIVEKGITLIIIEHVMTALMSISDRVMILHHGEKICEGKPDAVGRDKAVIEAYLGEEYQKLKEAGSLA
jgi:branched-chain amino acid transport system ATP-binding protein